MKKITIGSSEYYINYSQETANEILDKIIEWMEEDKHYAAHSGEGIGQDDNCQIDAPWLIADIIDDILQPKPIDE